MQTLSWGKLNSYHSHTHRRYARLTACMPVWLRIVSQGQIHLPAIIQASYGHHHCFERTRKRACVRRGQCGCVIAQETSVNHRAKKRERVIRPFLVSCTCHRCNRKTHRNSGGRLRAVGSGCLGCDEPGDMSKVILRSTFFQVAFQSGY